jgi:hypothetical protein
MKVIGHQDEFMKQVTRPAVLLKHGNKQLREWLRAK